MSEFDFAVIDDAGLSQGEFAELVGASRPTVNNWVKGRAPHKLFHAECKKQLLLLKGAVKLKLFPKVLPAANRYTSEERKKVIRDTLETVEAKLRKAQKAKKARR